MASFFFFFAILTLSIMEDIVNQTKGQTYGRVYCKRFIGTGTDD